MSEENNHGFKGCLKKSIFYLNINFKAQIYYGETYFIAYLIFHELLDLPWAKHRKTKRDRHLY